MSRFTQELKNLNQQQKRAVEAIDGPLLVVAGPGTGKTQLLSMRVANILNSTDTRPGNILCLTFTNKAAVNMKERIIELAGAAGAKVNAKTFHSFAAEIMNIYPDYFWNAAPLVVAPESVQLDIIESIVAKLPLDNPLALKFAGQYTLLNDIQRSINLAKDAGLTPDKLRVIINANLAYIDLIEPRLAKIAAPRLSSKNLESLLDKVKSLPPMEIKRDIYPLKPLSDILVQSLERAIDQDGETGKTTNCGAWKKRWLQSADGKRGMFDERRRNAWWLELADVYEKYRDQLHKRGFYDYADMLVEVIYKLEQTPEMRADIQERFNYVMIDEFQDTNPAQLRLAHLVSDHESANGSPNLMAVGDDDQSIFKFNGADLNNMMGFKNTYPKAQIIILTENYRSTQAVLDHAKKIIEQAEVRLVKSDRSLDKNLIAAAPPKDKGRIQAVEYSSRELQLSRVAQKIKSRYQPNRSMAVLARSHDSLLRMTNILQQLSVPVRYEQQSNVLDHEVVSQTYLIMKLLLAIQNGNKDDVNTTIHQIIRSPVWAIEPRKLWQMAVDNFKQPNWLSALLKSKDRSLSAIGGWFVNMAAEAPGQPLPITIEQIIGLRPVGGFTSPIKKYYTGGDKANISKYFHGLSALQLLRSLVHEFSMGSSPSVADFVRFIEVNKDNEKIVADESPFVTGGHAVQLLTVHKAKGLEFDEVYIIDAVENNWQPKKGGRKPPANLPLQPAGDDPDDYIRLMYVAATRARYGLDISAYSLDHAGKEVAVSPIVRAAFSVEKISEDNPAALTAVLEENLRWPVLSGGLESEMLKARLEEYSLSVTHLQNFLDVSRGGPQHFKERSLLRLPEAKSPSMSLGTAIHDALETAQKLTNKSKFNLAEVEKAFTKSLVKEQLTKIEHERLNKRGRQILSKLFDDFELQLPTGSLPEQKLRDIKLSSGAVINGKLDRVDTAEDKLTIVDYKTGRALPNLWTKDKNLAMRAYKHRLQLIFYALIAKNHPSYDKFRRIECQMVYVEADNQRDLVKSYRPEIKEIERLQKLIEIIFAKIKRLDLPDTSAYPNDVGGVIAFEEDLLAGRI